MIHVVDGAQPSYRCLSGAAAHPEPTAGISGSSFAHYTTMPALKVSSANTKFRQ